jgi:hypothetical protein
VSPSTDPTEIDERQANEAGRTCYCGCGRPIKGLRPTATNAVARQMQTDVLAIGGVARDDLVPERSEDLAALAEAGEALLTDIQSYLHGQLDRRDRNRKGEKEWLGRAGRVRNLIADAIVDHGFVGTGTRPAELVYGGRRAPGVVVNVVDTGMTVNTAIRVRVTVEVQPDTGPAFDATRTMLVSRISFPRIGDDVEVAYNPDDPDQFAYRQVLRR